MGRPSSRLYELVATKRWLFEESIGAALCVHSSGTCEYGVLRWPAQRQYVEELRLEVWQPIMTDDAFSTWEPVLNTAEWEVLFLHPVGPEFVETIFGRGEWKDGAFPPVRAHPSGLGHELYLMRASGWMSIRTAGAMEGYRRLSDMHLDKALRHT